MTPLERLNAMLPGAPAPLPPSVAQARADAVWGRAEPAAAPANVAEREVVCTRFGSPSAIRGTEHIITWGTVCAGLASADVFEAQGLAQTNGKYDKPAGLAGFSFARFKENDKQEKRRNGENVIGAYALGLDFDGTWTMPEAREFFESEGLEALIHSTFNDIDGTRFRVFVLFNRPATFAEYSAVWQIFQAKCGGRADENAQDASRFWYGPGVIEGRTFRTEHVRGKPLDLDALDLRPEAAPARPAREPSAPLPPCEHAGLEPRHLAAVAIVAGGLREQCPAVGAGGGRHAACFALAGALAHGDLARPTLPPLAQVAAFVEAAAREAGFGKLDVKRAAAEDSVRKMAAGDREVTGWRTLQEKFPALHAAVQRAFPCGNFPKDFAGGPGPAKAPSRGDASPPARPRESTGEIANDNGPSEPSDPTGARAAEIAAEVERIGRSYGRDGGANDAAILTMAEAEVDTRHALAPFMLERKGGEAELASRIMREFGDRLTIKGDDLRLDGQPAEKTLRRMLWGFDGKLYTTSDKDGSRQPLAVHARMVDGTLQALRDLLPSAAPIVAQRLDMSQPIPPVAWLVPGILVSASVGLIFGPPNARKTWLVLELIRCMAEGLPFNGRPVMAGKVIILDYEAQSQIKIKRRIATLGGLTPKGESNLLYINPTMPLDSPELWNWLEPEKPVLVVVDSLSRGMLASGQVRDQSADARMSVPLDLAATLGAKVGATSLFIHHANKGDAKGRAAVRGSDAIYAAAEVVMQVSAKGDCSTVRCDRQKEGQPFPDLTFRVIDGQGLLFTETEAPKTAVDKAKDLRAAILNALGAKGATEADIIHLLKDDGTTSAAVRGELKAMLIAGVARKNAKGKCYPDCDESRMGRIIEGPRHRGTAKEFAQSTRIPKGLISALVEQGWLEFGGDEYSVKHDVAADPAKFAPEIWGVLCKDYGWKKAPFFQTDGAGD